MDGPPPRGSVVSPKALFVSNTGDVHTDLLVRAAREQGIAFFRLNTDDFRRRGTLSLRIDRDWSSGALGIRGKQIALQDVGLTVYRRPLRAYAASEGLAPWVPDLVDREWKAVEEALAIVAECRVLNSIAGSAMARNKLVQLGYARRHGLSIPTTLVSTDQDEFTAFLRHHSAVITKGISASYVLDQEVVRSGFTQAVDPSSDFDPTGCPTLLQARIRAVAVWRIVVVADASFAVRYTGPALTQVCDSRQVHPDLKGEVRSAPHEVAVALGAMCRSLGISFCSADFVESPNGELVFVDLNPDGQWAWLQIDFDLPIAAAIVAMTSGEKELRS